MSKQLRMLKEQYESLKSEILDNDGKIAKLLENESVKEYIDLIAKNDKANREFERITFEYQRQRMFECKHVFVGEVICEQVDMDSVERIPIHHCIKCGLNTLYNWHYINENPRGFFSSIQCEMENIYNRTWKNGIFTKIDCPTELAQKIYLGIIKKYPNISDEDLVKYFKAALYNIENKDKEAHIEHLGLDKTKKMFIEFDSRYL